MDQSLPWSAVVMDLLLRVQVRRIVRYSSSDAEPDDDVEPPMVRVRANASARRPIFCRPTVSAALGAPGSGVIASPDKRGPGPLPAVYVTVSSDTSCEEGPPPDKASLGPVVGPESLELEIRPVSPRESGVSVDEPWRRDTATCPLCLVQLSGADAKERLRCHAE